MSTTTLDQVRADLAREGFTAELVADGHALRVATSPDRRHSLDDVAVARLVRVADPAGAPPPGGGLVFAIVDARDEPIGTDVPIDGAAEAAVVDALRIRAIPESELRSHREHDHVAAVFDSRQAAERSVAELRELGLGSDQLGAAVRAGASHAFERDAESELVHGTEVGVARGAAVGFLTGATIAAVTLVPGGAIGLGGILALGAVTGIGGGMIGGYTGEALAEQAFDERDELSANRLEPGQVLVALCSHGRPETVELVLRRNGGRLVRLRT